MTVASLNGVYNATIVLVPNDFDFSILAPGNSPTLSETAADKQHVRQMNDSRRCKMRDNVNVTPGYNMIRQGTSPESSCEFFFAYFNQTKYNFLSLY